MSLVTRSRVARLLVIAAAATLALVAVPSGRADAAGTPCQRTFASGPIDRPIPDLGAASFDIDVPEDGLVVTDVDVTVNLRHTAPTDLEIFLSSSTDALVNRSVSQLFDHDGGGDGVDLVATVFDDDAATAIAAGDAPFTGRFRPTEPMTVHHGLTGGRYRVLVQDTQARDSGTLDSWSATFTYETCDPDGDGVDVPADLCVATPAHTASGCPVATRAVSASYRKGRFRGVVSSTVPGCRAPANVTVWKARPGPDRRLGTTRTRADGSWRLVRARKPGRFYATSAPVVVPGVAECPAVKSTVRRVR